MRQTCLALVISTLILIPTGARAQIRITEWAYQGVGLEFFELTNMGNSGVDFTGWTYSDESDPPAAFDLSAFGVVAPGESVVVAESSEAAFRTHWGLSASVKVIGNLAPNLGRNDEINIFDASSLPVDRLDFGDQDFPGSIRTRADNEGSGNPATLAALGADDPLLWISSVVGDQFGSYQSLAVGAARDVGNPGIFALIPEPASLGMFLVGFAGLTLRRRR